MYSCYEYYIKSIQENKVNITSRTKTVILSIWYDCRTVALVTKVYDVVNQCLGLGQTPSCGGVNLVNGIPNLLNNWISNLHLMSFLWTQQYLLEYQFQYHLLLLVFLLFDNASAPNLKAGIQVNFLSMNSQLFQSIYYFELLMHLLYRNSRKILFSIFHFLFEQ